MRKTTSRFLSKIGEIRGIDIRYPHLIFFGCGLDKRRTHMAGNLVAEKKNMKNMCRNEDLYASI